MHRRSATQTVANNVRAAIDASDSSTSSVARATDMSVSDLEARLDNGVGFRFSEVVRVGGFLRLPVANLLEGVDA